MIPVCLGALASAWIVVAANAWMNTPVGFDFAGCEFRPPDPYRAIFNPAMPAETFHMIAAAYVAAGFAVAAVYALAMLRGPPGAQAVPISRLRYGVPGAGRRARVCASGAVGLRRSVRVAAATP
jgi:cytochrome bd-type quinol oxidase subunit 1